MFHNNRGTYVILLTSIAILLTQSVQGLSPGAKQKRSDEIQFLNPNELSRPTGYTHVVVVPQGKLVYVSGQASLDAKVNVVGSGDLRSRTTQALENLKLALPAAAATLNHA